MNNLLNHIGRWASKPWRAATPLAIALAAGTASGQVWVLNSADLDGRSESFADKFDGSPPCNPIDDKSAAGGLGPVPFVPGYLGADFGQFVRTGCKLSAFTCPLKTGGYGHVLVDGVGTATLTVQWWVYAGSKHSCQSDARGYIAWTDIIPFLATLNVDVGAVPLGTAITVRYAWNNRTAAKSVSEAGGEDDALVTGTALNAAGGDLFAAGGYSFDTFATALQTGSDSGVLNQVAGAPWAIEVGGEPFALIQAPGVGFYQKDRASAWHYGKAEFRLDGVDPELDTCADPELEFSLDIGSDTELSDPFLDGDEVFDPGDVYPWKGPFYAGPTSGPLDDALIFGFDHLPDPFGPPGPPNAAPVCSGSIPTDIAPDYFDLDGTDRTDFDIRDLLIPGAATIPAFPSSCVWEATNLAVSFDDDLSAHYAGIPGGPCEIPVLTPSPGLFTTWGVTGADDEIIGALVVGGATPAILGPTWGIADEATLHPNLAPNPDFGDIDDDDVDALDALAGPNGQDPPPACDFWYFSADHEATSGFFFDPGDIYLVTPGGGPFLALDDVVDLGLPDSVDIDAFEFAFHRDPAFGGPALVLLFSVDDDDPLTTGVDESGGLDPAQVYVSWMSGFFMDFLDDPFEDDVDALTVFCQEIDPTPPGPPTGACCFTCAPGPTAPCPDAAGAIGAPCTDLTPADCAAANGVFRGLGTTCADVPFPCQCPGDLTGDGLTDIFDFGALAGGFGTFGPSCATRADGDLNCDGVVDIFDFSILAGDFGCNSN